MPVGDSNFADVSLLLHGDGSNGATTFTDSSPAPKAVTRLGSAQVSTAQSKFGGASVAFFGGGDYLSVSDPTAFTFATGDFTIEAWVYIAGNSAGDVDGNRSAAILSTWDTSAISGYILAIQGDSSTTGTGLQLDSWGTAEAPAATFFRASAAIAQNTWHHIAATVQGGTRRLFLNGVMLSGASSQSPPGYTSFETFGRPLSIGGTRNTTYPARLIGFIDDLRITKGVARYTANFTPPTEAFPDSASTTYLLSGLVTGSAGTPVARVVRAQREDTGVYVGGAISDAATGAFAITTSYAGEHTVVAYPVTGEATLPALVHRGVIPI
ncbi:LamG domain-containing protein [Acidovorax sp. BL-A-41-H1]|uniref:LamG domain-containing protein n=1 Tax=Acidovorax sp. BL-A-41-H1 TaxID=3421102 RepID=UPI003F78EE76